jgi:O-antigen ligase
LLIALVEGSAWRPPLVLAALVGSTFLVATGARTGGVAVALGFGLAVAVGLLAQRSGWRLPGHRRRELAVASFLVLWVLVATPYAQSAIEQFVVKDLSDETLSLVETFAEGRGLLVAESWSRFAESPLLGRGFGVPASPETVATVGGIPASATVESGFFVSGILEQTGLLGLLAFFALLGVVLRPVARGRSLAAIALAATAVATNLGEATLFSFGGVGLMIWLVLLWAVVLAPSADPSSRDGLSG